MFKTDGRASKYEWRHNGEKIESDNKHFKDESDYKDESDKNTYGLSIVHYGSELEGKYECVVSTVEKPIVSTSAEVIVKSGKCANML